mmetsp:Transcript_23608/g.46383  ORF Transcript_23608/g.46383 Transcript_23608/m.46383 type:complete len:137 (-) Transcript_23608:1998-2408(-)
MSTRKVLPSALPPFSQTQTVKERTLWFSRDEARKKERNDSMNTWMDVSLMIPRRSIQSSFARTDLIAERHIQKHIAQKSSSEIRTVAYDDGRSIHKRQFHESKFGHTTRQKSRETVKNTHPVSVMIHGASKRETVK